MGNESTTENTPDLKSDSSQLRDSNSGSLFYAYAIDERDWYYRWLFIFATPKHADDFYAAIKADESVSKYWDRTGPQFFTFHDYYGRPDIVLGKPAWKYWRKYLIIKQLPSYSDSSSYFPILPVQLSNGFEVGSQNVQSVPMYIPAPNQQQQNKPATTSEVNLTSPPSLSKPSTGQNASAQLPDQQTKIPASKEDEAELAERKRLEDEVKSAALRQKVLEKLGQHAY